MSAFSHYKEHLSHFYTWMFGDFDDMVNRQKSLFQDHCHIYPVHDQHHHQESSTDSQPLNTKIALDLGSGSGFQSIALKQFGYDVHAIDFSEELLDELHKKDSSIHLHCGDMNQVLNSMTTGQVLLSKRPKLIVCMGDTITHVTSKADIVQLFQNSYQLLDIISGKFIITYRDLSNVKTTTERFIPVKSDENRILTCFLEDIDEDTVHVYDLLYEKQVDSVNGIPSWQLHKNYYPKLKLPVSWMVQSLKDIGFQQVVSKQLPNGMEIIVAQMQNTA